MKKGKRIISSILIVVLCMGVSGCSRENIFKEEEVPPSINPVKDKELENGGYYIKDGTNFYSVYKADASFTGSSDRADSENRTIWNTDEEDELIPTLYKGEVIAYCTETNIPTEFTLERFKDLGYTFGIKSLKDSDNGYHKAGTTGNIKSGSSLASAISGLENNEIGVSSVNGKELADENFTECGTIKGLKKGKKYTAGLYIGSVYGEKEVVADTHMYQSSETIKTEDIHLTKNGYVAIELPGTLKTGYYYIEGKGMFRYIADYYYAAKDLDSYDYNEKNSDTVSVALDDTLETDERVEKVTLDKNYLKTRFEILANTDGIELNRVTITLPSGDVQRLGEESTGKYVLELEEAEKGDYLITLRGKNLEKVEINVEKGDIKESAEQEAEPERTDETKTDTNNSSGNESNTQNTGSTSTKKNSGSSSSSASGSSSGTSYIYYDEPVTDPMDGPEQSDTMAGQ